MLNLFLGAAVCACAFVLGIALRRGYAARLRLARDYCALVAYLDEQINYCLTPLPKAIAQFGAAHPGALAEALAGYPDFAQPACLSSAQWQTAVGYLADLGRSDVAGQVKRLSLAAAFADAWRVEAQNDLQRKGDLYAKLCAFGGVGLMVIMM